MADTTAAPRVLDRLETASDWLSPVVVKEVRQFVRGREFLSSFAISLVVAMSIAFYGSADALGGGVASGRSTFMTLTGCLALLGFAVVPIGAFSTLRTERLEQTLDLISLTALSPRRIVVGKLLTQGVKLTTFFSVMAPFIATSFLLGGVDFVTILTALAGVFIWSMWAAAAALFMSTMFSSRAMSGVGLAGLAIVLFLLFVVGRTLLFAPSPFRVVTSSSLWWGLAVMAGFCMMTMVNLVLLSENRLAPHSDRSARALRVGFLIQFLLIVGWALMSLWEPAFGRRRTLEQLFVFGGLHLALVAGFGLTESLAAHGPSTEVRTSRRWPVLNLILGPGPGRLVAYLLVQMLILVGAAVLLGGRRNDLTLLLVGCGAICLFSGVPTLLARRLARFNLGPLHARGLVLFFVLATITLPDLLYYVIMRPDALNFDFSSRHLFSPLHVITNWNKVPSKGMVLPIAWCLVGVISYVRLVQLDQRAAGVDVPPGLRLNAASDEREHNPN